MRGTDRKIRPWRFGWSCFASKMIKETDDQPDGVELVKEPPKNNTD